MAWTYFQEAAGSQKDSTSGSSPSLTVKSSQALSACSCPEWVAASCPQHRSGMTCGRCGGLRSPRWTSLLAVSLARTSARLELERAWTESEAGLCLNTSASLASADLDSSSWKTYQLSLFGGSTAFSWDSMRWGMMRDGRLFQPQRWEPTTCENESGYWPTPTAREWKNSIGSPTGRHTETLAHRAAMWPTPTANDCKPASSTEVMGFRQSDRRTTVIRLRAAATEPHQIGGPLNPTWVEWLMGWPIGSTVCESWVMESSHFARGKRSAASRGSREMKRVHAENDNQGKP